jgi:hypothetical protein
MRLYAQEGVIDATWYNTKMEPEQLETACVISSCTLKILRGERREFVSVGLGYFGVEVEAFVLLIARNFSL